METIGKHIRQLRKQEGFSLHKVAGFLNISPALLRNIERGQRNATKDQIIKLASYFGTDLKDMLSVYLNDRLSVEEQSERLQQISNELRELHDRQIQAQIHKPASPLDSSIEHMVYYRGNNKVGSYERAIPDGSVQLVIELGGNEKTLLSGNSKTSQQSLRQVWIEGVQERSTTCQLNGTEATLTVKFTRSGFYPLTGIPTTETTNAFIDAESIFGASIVSLRERLLSSVDISSMFHVVEAYFQELISSTDKKAPLVEYLIDNIETPVTELAEKTGYSHKHIIRIFKRCAGVSPKYSQRIYRFNKTIKDILTSTHVDWSDVVFNNGFYDQSHFIKEFNHFTGLNPGSYLQTGSTCSNLLHLNRVR